MLPGTHRNARRIPGRRQIVCQVGESARIDFDVRVLFSRLAGLQLSDTLKRALPVLLQLCGDETIVGIAGSITTFGQACLVAGLLHFQAQDVLPVFLLFPMHPLRLKRGVDRHWFHHPQHLLGDRGVDPWTAKGHTPGQPHHKVWLVAAIYRSALRIAGVEDAQTPPASSTDQYPRQERPAATARLCASSTPVIVEGDLLLIALIFRPIDVAFMVILDHHLPCPHRLAMPITPSRSAVDDGSALFTLPIHVDARVKWIFQYRDHIAVTDRHPVESGHAAFIGGAREVDLIGFHREQYLPRAAKFAETGKDEPDHLLQTQVGIEPEPGFAMPDVAEWN